MKKKKLVTDSAPSPAGPYSQGIEAGNFVFVSGQRPVDPVTGQMRQGIEEQTRQVLANVQSVLAESGCGLKDVVRVMVYLSDISFFDEMNKVYREMMPEPFPARTTAGVQLRGILVEMDVIAVKEDIDDERN